MVLTRVANKFIEVQLPDFIYSSMKNSCSLFYFIKRKIKGIFRGKNYSPVTLSPNKTIITVLPVGTGTLEQKAWGGATSQEVLLQLFMHKPVTEAKTIVREQKSSC